MTTQVEVSRLDVERQQAESLAQIASELATLNKTMKLIAESLRAIGGKLP